MIKKIYLAAVMFILALNTNAQNDTMYIMKSGVVVGQHNINTEVDSVIFYQPVTNAQNDTMYIMKSGVVVGEHNINTGVDSVIFYQPVITNTFNDLKDSPDWVFQYVDTYDSANVFDGNYGINDNLNERQLYGDWQGTNWVKRSGVQFDNELLYLELSQVNHPFYPSMLTFHADTSALMLDYRIWPGTEGRYRISFDTDPVLGDTDSPEWLSFMLDNDENKNGHVADMDLGFLIRSNGEIAVYQDGNLIPVTLSTGALQISDTYNVVLDITPTELLVVINGISKNTFALSGIKIESAHPYIGAEILLGSAHVSSFDNLVINTVKNNKGHILKYGYYWANGTYGNHLSEVEDFTNFNFVESAEHFSSLNQNVLQVKWQFWGNGVDLNANWEALWSSLLDDHISPNLDKIQTLYIFDEPFVGGVDSTDYNMILSRVKTDVPNTPISAVFAPDIQYCGLGAGFNSQLDKIASVIDNLDYIGVDKYSVDFEEIKQTYLDPLGTLIQDRNKRMILVPQTFFTPGNSSCGFDTDHELAKLNWDYYNYALENNFVIAIKNYGLWTDTPSELLPLTLQVQKLLGESITNY